MSPMPRGPRIVRVGSGGSGLRFWALLPMLIFGLAAAASIFVGAVLFTLVTAPFRLLVRRGAPAPPAPPPPAPDAETEPFARPAPRTGRIPAEIEDARFEEVV